MNPTDLPSRGCTPKRLYEAKWWKNPGCLYKESQFWLRVVYKYDEKEVSKEQKKSVTSLLNQEFPRVD